MKSGQHMNTYLNTLQRRIIITALVVLILMLLFPPWTDSFDAGNQYNHFTYSKPIGYAFIATPPSPSRNLGSIRVDLSRLAIQIVVIILITLLAMMLAKGRTAFFPNFKEVYRRLISKN